MIPLLYLGDNSGYFVSQAKIAKKNQYKTIKQLVRSIHRMYREMKHAVTMITVDNYSYLLALIFLGGLFSLVEFVFSFNIYFKQPRLDNIRIR